MSGFPEFLICRQEHLETFRKILEAHRHELEQATNGEKPTTDEKMSTASYVATTTNIHPETDGQQQDGKAGCFE